MRKLAIVALAAAALASWATRAQTVGFFHETQRKDGAAGDCIMKLEYSRTAPGISGIYYGRLDCPATAEKAMENILARATAAEICERGPGAPMKPRAKEISSTADTCRAVIVHPVGDPSEPRIIFDDPECRHGAPVAMATLVTFLLAHPNPGQ